MKYFARRASALVWGLLAAACARPAAPAANAVAQPTALSAPAGTGALGSSEASGGVLAGSAAAPTASEVGLLAEAPAPGDVIAHVRVRDPRRSLSTVSTAAGLPSDAVEDVLKKGSTRLVGELLGEAVDAEAFGPLVDLSAPIDFVVAATGGPSVTTLKSAAAFSFGVTSLPRALAATKAKPERRGEGYWQFASPEGANSPPCGLFQAAGRSPARLVCAKRGRDVATLGPWLATSLAKRELPGAELHGEVRLRPLLDKVGPELRLKAKALPLLAGTEKIGIPVFDNALMEAASALGDEFGNLTSDIDSFELDAGFDPADGVRITAKASFAGKTSWTVQRLVEGPATITQAPEIFGRAPKGSSSASYGHGADPDAFEGVLRVLRGLAEGSLEKLKFATPADRKALTALLRLGDSKFVPTFSAQGRFDVAAADLVELQGLVAGALGWYLIGFDDAPKTTVAWLNDLVKVYNRPALQAWMKGELQALMKGEREQRATFLPTLKIVPAPSVLGAGALDIELKVANLDEPSSVFAALSGGAAKKTPGATSVSVHVLVMADGNRTFVGFAADRDKLAALMANSKGKVAGPETLAAVATLDAFRREPHRAGMFVTVKGSLAVLDAAKPYVAFLPPDVATPVGKFFTAMGQLPHGGTTPITFTSDSAQGPRPSLSMRFTVPQHALDDVGYLVKVVVDEVKQLAQSAAAPSLQAP